jgi:hypothetical protein
MFPYAPKVYRDYLRAHPRMPTTVKIAGTKKPANHDPSKPLVTIRPVPAGPTEKPRILAWRRLIFQVFGGDEIAVGERTELLRDLVVESVYARIGVHKVNVIGEPGMLYDPDDSTPIGQITIDALFRANR